MFQRATNSSAKCAITSPPRRLYAGDDGFAILSPAGSRSSPVAQAGRLLIMELGYRSAPAVTEMLAGWRDVEVRQDLAGLPRVVKARLIE